MTLRDKMLAVMQDVNSQVVEREELVELIAIALLTRNNLFILGKPGQAKSLSINLFRQRITGARQFERLLSKQTDEDQLFGRIDLSSLIPGSVPDAVLQDDEVHKNLRFDLQCMVDGLGARKDTPDTFAMLEKAADKLLSYRKAVAALHQNEPVVQTAGKIPEADIVFLDEIFKANDGVLNSLLTALNERKYTNEGRTYPIPAISFFSASNEIPNFADPQEQILAPLYDRLQIKVVTEDIADRDKRLSVLKSKQNGGDGSVNATISLPELYAMQQEVAAIPVPDTINELADDVLCELRNMGIRFISVNDDLDSEHTPLCDDISIPIKNIMNEAYCRSLSQKLRAQFRVQRKAGEFLGAFACYGYLKDPADKHKLIIDEYAAMVVRTIFQLKMEGYSQQAIANYLSSEGVLPPAAYKQQQGLKYQSGFQAVGDNNAWSPVAVRAILENPIYIGTLVQGKRGTPNYKIKQMKLRSKEDWCIVEKNHAPIISEELFTSVQHLLSLDTRTSPSKKVVQPLAGMLYCADCGRAMCRRSVKRGNRTFYYYVCSTHKRSKLCSSHSISQTVLENVVLRAIQKQIEMVVDIDQLIHEIGQKSVQAAKHRQLDMTIEEKEKQITEQKEYRMRLLEAFHDDLISRTEYDMMRQRYTQRIDALQAVLASLHERRQALEEGAADTRNWVAEYTKFRKIDRLTREMVAGLIRRITVSEGKQVTIQFNYADELASYQQMIAAAAKEVG